MSSSDESSSARNDYDSRTYTEENKMRYLPSFKRFEAAEARAERLSLALDMAYGEAGRAFAAKVAKANNIQILQRVQILQKLKEGLKNRVSLEELQQVYNSEI